MKLTMKFMRSKNWNKKAKPKDLKIEAGKYKYDFQIYETVRSFGERIYVSKISIHKVEMDQTNLLEYTVKFNNKSRPKTREGKDKKQNTIDSVSALYKGRELTLNDFKSGILPIKETQGK